MNFSHLTHGKEEREYTFIRKFLQSFHNNVKLRGKMPRSLNFQPMTAHLRGALVFVPAGIFPGFRLSAVFTLTDDNCIRGTHVQPVHGTDSIGEFIHKGFLEMKDLSTGTALGMHMPVAVFMFVRILIIPGVPVRFLVSDQFSFFTETIHISVDGRLIPASCLILDRIVDFSRGKSPVAV
jgi:hypothetical protein